MHAETQETIWQGGATPQQRARTSRQGLAQMRPTVKAAASHEQHARDEGGGAEPDGAIPREVVDKNIQEHEARVDHRRW